MHIVRVNNTIYVKSSSGTAKLQLKFGGNQYLVEMIVADLRTEGIVGLETYQCAVDLSQGTMKLSGNDYPISLYRTINSSHQTIKQVSVVLSNDISYRRCTQMHGANNVCNHTEEDSSSQEHSTSN